ncbi:MAG: O-antigen ligase family protein [Candidatus Omnitrophica bacterium]|nr:O-antigen ligase family protein [Candidatus Omnitrophota bacterium]
MNKTIFPYLNTRFETDILLTLLLTPVWWLTGLNIFVYQMTAVFAFTKLIITIILKDRPLIIPKPLLWFALFLISYLFSILINLGNYPAQRVMASLNNYFVFGMGFLLMVTIYHGEGPIFLNLFRISRILCMLTGGIAIFFLVLWLVGHEALETHSLLGRLFPALDKYPFFRELLTIRITSSDWLMTRLPRLAIYSQVHTALGGFLLMITPLAFAAYAIEKKYAGAWFFGLLTAVPVIFSLSRTVWCAFIVAFAFVRFLEQKRKFLWVVLFSISVLLASNLIYSGMDWILKLRHQSTINRFEIYEQAIDVVKNTNILFGIGVRLREGRDEYLMMSLGSHSTYVGLLLVTGVMGLALFIGFQLAVGIHWYGQKSFAQEANSLFIWRYLGTSYFGASIWFLTDTLDALPFTAYTYFVIVSCIFLFGRFLKEPLIFEK